MDWTFWTLCGVAALSVGGIVWLTLDYYGFLSEGWDDHMDEWSDE